MAFDLNKERENLAAGRGLSAGVCFNPDRDPDLYECGDDDETAKIAKGEISVSWDGRTVTDLKTGEVTTREQPDEYKVTRVTTLAEMAEASGGSTPDSTGADTQTTDNAPAGGRGGRGTRATG